MKPFCRRQHSSSRCGVRHLGFISFALSLATCSASPFSTEASASRRAGTWSRVTHPAAKARAEKVLRNAFRPYDESSGRSIAYGDGHPYERRRRLNARGDAVGEDLIDHDQIAYALGKSSHQPLRIHFLTDALDEARGQSDVKDRKIDALEQTVLPAIANEWSRALSVFPVQDVISVPRDACFGLVNLQRSIDVGGADIVIVVDVASREDLACTPEGNNALAVAAPCEADQWDRPIIGFMNFCLEKDIRDTDNDYQNPNMDEVIAQMTSIGTHEAGHCLGMVGDLLKYFRDPETGEPLTSRPFRQERVACVDGAVRNEYRPSRDVLAEGATANGARYFELVTPRIATVARNHFNCASLRGARLENQPTSESCFGSHFDERLFFTELMGPVYSSFSNALSPMTMAFFEDSSWYIANYSASVPSTFGHGAGCDFVYKDCIQDGDVPEYSKGFFCNQRVQMDSFGRVMNTEVTCDPTRTHKAVCDLALRDEVAGLPDTDIPDPFQYFPEDQDLGAFSMWLADFCPIATIDYMDCQDATNVRTSEYFGTDSRCYDVRVDDIWQGTKVGNSMCFKTICNADRNVVELEVRGSRIVCDYDGQVHSLGEISGSAELECPRFAVVCPELICPGNCAGRGVCNWESASGPTCECFDEADTSPGCFGSAKGNYLSRLTPAPTPRPTMSPPISQGQPDDSLRPAPTPSYTIPNSIFKTEKPVYEGPIIILGPSAGSTMSSAPRITNHLIIYCSTAVVLVLTMLCG
uniref:EGF-like domain-containing protein n=1 Tax=Pseudictyota dubia TaxID=2749911 RepID=A0A7R9W347_9STRA